MKILMVSSFLPYPLINGGNIRLYNLLKNLSDNFEITLICEKREFQKISDIKEVEKFCKKVVTVDRKKQWTFSNILKSGLSVNPFLIVGHTNSEMKNKIKEELKKEDFDLIHVETFYVMQNLPKTNIPIVLVEHNIEYSVYKRFVDHSPFFLRPLLSWDVKKMERIEKSFWNKAKVLVAVSGKEKEIMNADVVVPNGVDIEKFKPKTSQKKEKRILFIGDFKWLENRDTARWIIRKLWPEIKVKIQESKLWIVGKNMPDDIKKIKDSRIILDENAPSDASVIYSNAFILLAPIRMGGGTSFKILEAMSSGVPVVTTSFGAEGITDGNDLVKANNIKEIVDAVLKLFNDKKYYEDISKRGRDLIEEKFNWKSITKELEKIYQKTVKND